MVIPLQRLPWRCSWHVTVDCHLERQHGRMVTIRWPEHEHIKCHVFYDGRRWHARTERPNRLPTESTYDNERQAKRAIERIIAAEREARGHQAAA